MDDKSNDNPSAYKAYDCSIATKFSKPWVEELIDGLRGQFSMLHLSITDVSKEISALNDNRTRKVDVVSKIATDAMSTASRNAKDIQLRFEMKQLKDQCSVY